MNRRDFLSTTVAFAGAVLSPRRSAEVNAASNEWRTFELTTRVRVLEPAGVTRVWLPAALIVATPYQRTLANTHEAHGGIARLLQTRADALGIVVAEYPAGTKPVLTLTSRVATRNHVGDLSRTHRSNVDRETLEHFLRPTRLLPTGGIVKAMASDITQTARTDLEKARAIYDWIVDHTFRDPDTRGCGLGDIRFMLESRSLGGKCADLNALFVGLARAAGLPARDVYGIRAAKSAAGFTSLGTSSANVSKSQHCRAEVHLQDFGWVPVDPADVRKVALEEPPGNRNIDDAIVGDARKRLFGSWEMNWIAYNFAHDVTLPKSGGPPLPFLMYPQAETAKGRLDSLDPERFTYEITSREIGSP